MLGEIKDERKRIYLNIKDGAVVRRTENGEQRFAYVTGAVENIYTRDREFRGETVKYWYINLRDPSGELYSIGFSFRSNVFKSIVMSLASAGSLNDIKIAPYVKNNYEKVIVYEGDKKLDWFTKELPPIETVAVDGREIKNDFKRMGFISSVVDKINAKISGSEK